MSFKANIVVGDSSLEVKPHECNVTSVLKRIISRHEDCEFLLYIGDSPSNQEELRKMPHVFTCGVGIKNQKYYLEEMEEAVSLLRTMMTNGETVELPKKISTRHIRSKSESLC